MGFWRDCSNPLNKLTHGFWSEPTKNEYSRNIICPCCWHDLGYSKMITVPGPLKKTRLDATPEKDTL